MRKSSIRQSSSLRPEQRQEHKINLLTRKVDMLTRIVEEQTKIIHDMRNDLKTSLGLAKVELKEFSHNINNSSCLTSQFSMASYRS